MANGVKGAFAARYLIPYSDASNWGTGINPVHAIRTGSSPRETGAGLAEVIPASEAASGFVEISPPWGYDPNDIAGLDVVASQYQALNGVYFDPNDRPIWGESTPETRAYIPVDSARPWDASGGYKNILRSVIDQPGNANTLGSGYSYEIPTETVSEGWLNKPASGKGMGETADAQPSDPSQYEVQTSMQQRYAQQNNNRSQMRGTDDAREPIGSRTAPMKLKVYSGQQRHYDMFPRQIDQMPRAFWYRRAGTGRIRDLRPNEMIVVEPLQRTVPPDPSLGQQEIEIDSGYTSEDTGWY
jgi:hypothetical protein